MIDSSLIRLIGLPVLLATLKVAVVAAAGYILARRKLLHEGALRDLSALVVGVTVPCLVFSTTASGVSGMRGAGALTLILAAPITIGAGWLVGMSLLKVGRLDEFARKPVILCNAFANSSYLPIAVATSVMPALAAHFPGLAPKAISQTCVVCISIYLVLYSPLFWGYAFWWLKGDTGARLTIDRLLSPPVIGLGLGYLVGLTPIHLILTPPHAPLNFLMQGINDLGSLTIPLANLILGGMLCTARTLREAEGSAALIPPAGRALCAIGKLVVTPAITYFVLSRTVHLWSNGDILTLAAAIILLEAATPGATNLSVMGSSASEGRHGMAIAEILLTQYPLCIITVPLWLTLFFGLLPR